MNLMNTSSRHKHLIGLAAMALLCLFDMGSLCAQGGQVEDKDVLVEKVQPINMPLMYKIFDKILPETVIPKEKLQTYLLNTPEYTPAYLKILVGLPKENNESPIIEENKLESMLKAGGGNYSTLYGEGFLSHKVSQRFQYGAQARYLSSFTGPVGNDDYSARNEIKGHIYTSFYSKKSKFFFSTTYQRNAYRFYGYEYNENNVFNKADSMKQTLDRIQISLTHSNRETNNKFHFDYGFYYTLFKTRFDKNENQLNLKGDLSYLLSPIFKLSFHSDNWFSTLSQEGIQTNRILVKAHPDFEYKQGRLLVNAGLNLIYQNDTLSNTQNFLVYPSLKLSYQFAELLAFTLGYEGDIERVSLQQLNYENPYLKNAALPVFHSNKQNDVYAKIQGNILPKFYYSALVRYAEYKNLYFYSNSINDSAKFEVVYNTDLTKLFYLEGQLGYQIRKNLNTRLRLSYWNYQLPNQGVAFYRPTFETNLMIRYEPIKKLSTELNFYVMSGIRALNVRTAELQSLSSIYDLNLKAEYNFYKKLSSFVNLNNIFAQQYQRYLNYPNQGFNFLIGLGYVF